MLKFSLAYSPIVRLKRALAQDQIVGLDIQKDFAEKLAASRPVQTLAELVWNGFDAEATVVKITAEAGEIRLPAACVSLPRNYSTDFLKIYSLNENKNSPKEG